MKKIKNLLLVMALLITMVTPVQATSERKAYRISGSTRYETALNLASAITGCGEYTSLIVATGKNFPDALSASYLSAVETAPIILINESNQYKILDQVLPYVSKNATVYFIGGYDVVSKGAEDYVKPYVNKTVRLAGETRYETNMEILEEASKDDNSNSTNSILICTGKKFADALSVSSVGLPILLVRDNITDEQLKIVAQYKKVYLIGSADAVSTKVENKVKKVVDSVERLGGETRYETSKMVADKFFPNATTVTLTTGKNFPDGLCGGLFANINNAPVLLTKDGNNAAKQYVESHNITTAYIFGGSDVVSDKAVKNTVGVSATDLDYEPGCSLEEVQKQMGETSSSDHEHVWEPVYKTVHHDAEYETVHHDEEGHYEEQEVLVKEAWDEEVTERHHGYLCNGCGAKIETSDDNNSTRGIFIHIMVEHDGNASYGTWGEDVVVDTIHHDAVYETQEVWIVDKEAYDEQVLVKDAYDEQVIDYYKCSVCGETKPAN